jgi:hypothetical protein
MCLLIFFKHGKAASYQADKMRIKTRVVWFTELPQRRGIRNEEQLPKSSCGIRVSVGVLVFRVCQ